MPLDEVRDHLGVGLGRELVALLEERRLQLAVVLDDPVEDEVDVALKAAGQRVRILGANAPVRCPARVPDAGRRQGLALRRSVLQLAEVADRADLGELPVLDERQTGGVIPAVFEPLEAVQEDRLCDPGSDVSDDPAHLTDYPPPSRNLLQKARRARPPPRTQRRVRSAELPCYKRRDASTESPGFLVRRRLREHPHDRLRARRAHEHTAV